MERFRLSSDILSPLHSDISLNDVSVFSFGSLPGTPVLDTNITPPICKTNSKDSNINLLRTENMKECASGFDKIENDFKKQSSIDILSPLHSDISLNDVSAVSFGSLPGTPVDTNIRSLIYKTSSKDSDTSLLCTDDMKVYASGFDKITNDIKKQLSTTSEKEEKYKETYKELKKSMDDLFGKESNSSPYLSKHKTTSKRENLDLKFPSEKNSVGKFQNSKIQKTFSKNRFPGPENISETTEKNSEICTKEKYAINKMKRNQHPSKNSSVSEALKSSKNKNESLTIEKKDTLIDKKKNSKIISSKNDEASVETKGASSKSFPEKKKHKETGDLKNYHYKCQKKIPISDDKPAVENKSMSIEKSIQLAVSMEMDNLRRFVLHQNFFIQKDLLKLQETVKKQNEVTEYLFSVIDELLDTNKKLISKCN